MIDLNLRILGISHNIRPFISAAGPSPHQTQINGNAINLIEVQPKVKHDVVSLISSDNLKDQPKYGGWCSEQPAAM